MWIVPLASGLVNRKCQLFTLDGEVRIDPRLVAARILPVGWQTFTVVAGAGWVTGGNDQRRAIRAGQTAMWMPDEEHASGTDDGMTVLITEGTIEPSSMTMSTRPSARWHAERVAVQQIRPARLEDADGVWPLARDFATSFTPVRAAFDRTWVALVGAPDMLLLVAEADGGRIVGYLLGNSHLTFLANGPVAWVEEIMVRPDLRRAGIGRHLMAYVEDWARSIGAGYVALASRRAAAFLYDTRLRGVCALLQEGAGITAVARLHQG